MTELTTIFPNEVTGEELVAVPVSTEVVYQSYLMRGIEIAKEREAQGDTKAAMLIHRLKETLFDFMRLGGYAVRGPLPWQGVRFKLRHRRGAHFRRRRVGGNGR